MTLKARKFKIPDSPGFYNILEFDEFEFVNPIERISYNIISSSIYLQRHILSSNGIDVSNKFIEKYIVKQANEDWLEKYENCKSINLPKNLYNLIEANSKAEQEKALKGISLTTDEFIAFILMAYEKYGYVYSLHKASHNHKGLDESLLPNLMHIEEDGSIVTIGQTPLSKGQQKQAIEHRKVVVSKFLDNGKNWHCFFHTYKGLSGKEMHNNRQPHLHYISDKWNIDRQEVINQLKSKDYKLPALPHINYYTPDNQKKEEK